MNVEIGAEAALFPEKEYIKGIFVAVWEVDSIAACASFMGNANANDGETSRSSLIILFLSCWLTVWFLHGMVVMFAKHGARHPYVLGS
jgi:hypothetical protein